MQAMRWIKIIEPMFTLICIEVPFVMSHVGSNVTRMYSIYNYVFVKFIHQEVSLVNTS